MPFDFSTLVTILIVVLALQPILMGRWSAMQRSQAIRAVEKAHGARVITMIHRQEKRSLFGFSRGTSTWRTRRPSSRPSRRRLPTCRSIW